MYFRQPKLYIILFSLSSCISISSKTDKTQKVCGLIVIDDKWLEARINRKIDITGIASMAKMGPILMLNSGIPIYIEKFRKWPKNAYKKRINATGILKKTGGPISKGTSDLIATTVGERYLLKRTKWKVCDKL